MKQRKIEAAEIDPNAEIEKSLNVKIPISLHYALTQMSIATKIEVKTIVIKALKDTIRVPR